MKIIWKIIIAIPLCFVLLMVITLAFATVEPFYTIKNSDQYPHNVTVRINGYEGEYYQETYYQLEPGETVQVKKPINIILRWSNPFTKGELYYAPGKYESYIGSEDKKHFFSGVPSLSTTYNIELTNESGKFEIDSTRYL